MSSFSSLSLTLSSQYSLLSKWSDPVPNIRTPARPHCKTKIDKKKKIIYLREVLFYGASFLISDRKSLLYRNSVIFQSLQICFTLNKICIMISVLEHPFSAFQALRRLEKTQDPLLPLPRFLLKLKLQVETNTVQIKSTSEAFKFSLPQRFFWCNGA